MKKGEGHDKVWEKVALSNKARNILYPATPFDSYDGEAALEKRHVSRFLLCFDDHEFYQSYQPCREPPPHCRQQSSAPAKFAPTDRLSVAHTYYIRC